jgi:hypothetical protein
MQRIGPVCALSLYFENPFCMSFSYEFSTARLHYCAERILATSADHRPSPATEHKSLRPLASYPRIGIRKPPSYLILIMAIVIITLYVLPNACVIRVYDHHN